MSDEEGPELPGFIIDMAQFMQQQREEHMAHHQMSVDDAQHRLQTFFNEANREGLEAIQTLMRVVIHSDHPEMLAAYYDGIISAILGVKHNICVACGRDHDEELAQQLAAAEGESTPDE